MSCRSPEISRAIYAIARICRGLSQFLLLAHVDVERDCVHVEALRPVTRARSAKSHQPTQNSCSLSRSRIWVRRERSRTDTLVQLAIDMAATSGDNLSRREFQSWSHLSWMTACRCLQNRIGSPLCYSIDRLCGIRTLQLELGSSLPPISAADCRSRLARRTQHSREISVLPQAAGPETNSYLAGS